MELKTTEEFVREAHSAACTYWKKRIEKEFPEAFETQLEVGKWYVSKTELHDWLMNYQGNSRGYGFNTFKEWANYYIMSKEDDWREATHEEVESALIAEAKKRGFLEGAKFKSSLSENGKIRTVREFGSWIFYTETNRLNISTPECEWENSQSNPVIFEDGKWAEIITEEKTTISKEKALKIIAKKLKVSPENIEIN